MSKTITTIIVPVAGLILDTDDLSTVFGIPQDKHLDIHSIVASAPSADFIVIAFDKEIPIADCTIDGVNPENNTGKLRLDVGVASVAQEFVFHNPIHVNNRMVFNPSTQIWTLAINYSHREGALDWTQERVETLPDIKQLSGYEDKTAGKEFFQVGDRFKVGDP